MSKLMIDPVMAGKLRAMKDPILLCDTAGQVLGRVVPASPYDDVIVPFSEEELRHAEEESAEHTLAEVLSQLEKQ